jgi:hypothetical protein
MDEGTIFESTDRDGDSLLIRSWLNDENPRTRNLVAAVAKREYNRDLCDETALYQDDVIRLRDALTTWLGDGDEKPSVTDFRDIARDVFREELSTLRVPPYLGANTPAEHVPHDCDWGVPCFGCGHVSGVHARGGCHAMKDGEYCGCELDSAGAVNAPAKPRTASHPGTVKVVCHLCKEPWTDGHGNPGDPCAGPLHPAETATKPRSSPLAAAVRSTCTCHDNHTHVVTDTFFCGYTGCYCPNAGKRAQS